MLINRRTSLSQEKELKKRLFKLAINKGWVEAGQ